MQTQYQADEHRTIYRRCAASATRDLLDCDCGYVTDHMKIHLLAILDEHTSHTIERGLDHERQGSECASDPR